MVKDEFAGAAGDFQGEAMTSEVITIEITPQVAAQLKALLETGLFGWSIEDAAERLIAEGILHKLVELKRGRP